MIFFDHNATTRLAPQVLAKMTEAYQLPLNNSSSHQLGRHATKLVEAARQELKNLLNAENYEVIFTGSSTEATNSVMFGSDAEKIFFSAIEHSSVYECRPAGKKIVEIAALENGLIDLEDFEKKITPHPNPLPQGERGQTELGLTPSPLVGEGGVRGNFLTCAMLANNETGAIQPVEEIAKLTHQKGGLFHCDLVQALGKIPVDLEKINADFAAVSAHKLNGPQGVGALLIRKGLEIRPLIFGGKQEKSKRAGTTNVAGIAGFGEACKLATQKISAYESVKKLRDFLEAEVKKIGGENVKIFAENVARLPNTSYIATRNCDAQTQLINFDLNGICVSAGPACSSGSSTASRILQAMQIAPEFSTSAIRVSLAPENTRDEVEKFVKIWGEFYQLNKN